MEFYPYDLCNKKSYRGYKLFLIMKLIVFFLLIGLLEVSASGFAQQVTLSEKNAKLEQIFNKIRKQTGYDILCDADIIKNTKPVTIKVKDSPLTTVLEKCFEGQRVSFSFIQGMVVVRKTNELLPSQVKFGTVKGTVTDTKGLPLPGVSVKLKSASSGGASTDKAGHYSITIPELTGTLVFSYIGYAQLEVPINGRTNIDVQLAESNTALNEVVVVAYGTQTTRNLVGSVATLSAANIKDQPTGTFAERLTGKLPGVQAAQGTGRPGQGMDIRIRGAASLTSSVRPLFVVDGIPMIGNPDNINNINPDEIESFSVLKDASSTSMYGSRGANGVILITTKRGKSGAPKIEFNSYYGLAENMKELKPEVMDATQLATYMKGFFEDKALYEGYTGGVPGAYQNPEQYGKGTDWYDLLTRQGAAQNYSLAISSGNDKSTLSITGGYFDQDGIVKNTGYKRFSLRINGDVKLTDNIKLGVSLAPSVQLEHNNRQNRANSSGFNVDGQRAIFASTLMMPTMGSPYNTDGSLSLGIGSFPNMFVWANPLRQLTEINDDVKRTRVLGNIFAEIGFLKHFTFRTSANLDLGNMQAKKFVPSTAFGGFNDVPVEFPAAGSNDTALGESYTENPTTWLNENLLSYKNTFAKDHTLEVLAGFTAQRFDVYSSQIVGRDYPDNSVPYLSAATRFTTNTSAAYAWTMLSALSRLNYTYKNRYSLQASVRRDGSSRFGSNNRWGTFPSIGATWIASEEAFLKDFSKISFLKIRASYGLTGQNEFGGSLANQNYAHTPTIGNSNYVFGSVLAPGKVQSGLGNIDLVWERNKQLDLGIDIGLFKDRINLTYDYYNKYTDGLLFTVPVPHSSGYTSVQDNLGDIRQWGHEFTLSTKNLTGAFKWNTDFNISFNRNIVKKIGVNNVSFADNPSGVLSEFTDWRTIVGKPIGQYFGYVFDGVFMTQAEANAGPKYYGTSPTSLSQAGTVRYKDLNGDGKITWPEDMTIIGNPNPDFIFGFTNSFSYKNFDLNIVLSGTYGNDLYNGVEESTYNLDGVFNGPPELLQRWRSEANPGNGLVPRTLAGTTGAYRANSSRWVHDASHITINNIALGYTFRKFTKMPYVKSLRLYTTVQNAYIFTSYPGNPEVSINGLTSVAQGQDLGAYPIPRTFTFGINLVL